jgi:hypothetical protein
LIEHVKNGETVVEKITPEPKSLFAESEITNVFKAIAKFNLIFKEESSPARIIFVSYSKGTYSKSKFHL